MEKLRRMVSFSSRKTTPSQASSEGMRRTSSGWRNPFAFVRSRAEAMSLLLAESFPIDLWWASLKSRLQPRCPHCDNPLLFLARMPHDYPEVSPKFFTCSYCEARYVQDGDGEWVGIPLSDRDTAFLANG